MAYPTILIDSATGDDTNASGAGPSTAITSTSASTSVDGLTVTIPNANLSAVATDGSHAVYISGEGLRSITGTADSGLSTANVTVGTAFTGSLSSQTAAIGGVRKYLFGSTKSEIESSCEAGWTISLAAGHSESLTAPTTLSFGDTKDNPITISGDASNKAHFLNLNTSFTYQFDFDGSAGIRVENVDFEHYRGSSVGDEGAAYHIVYVPAYSYWKNCSVTAASMYSTMALWYSRFNAAMTFLNCEAKFLSTSSYKYANGTGFAIRTATLIGCTAEYMQDGFALQTFGAYQSVISFCQADVKNGIACGNGYDQGGTVTGNIFKLQDTGAFFTFPANWIYSTTSLYQIFNNVVTSDGSYTSVSLNVDTPSKHKRIVVMNNCFHGGTIDSNVDDYVQLNNISTDPQLTGNVGSFAIGSQSVIDHVGISDGISGGGGSTFHPLG